MSFIRLENDAKQADPKVNGARRDLSSGPLFLTSRGVGDGFLPGLRGRQPSDHSGTCCCLARHDERSHWAREIHDRLGQYTAVLSLHLSRLLAAASSQDSRSCYASLADHVDLLDAELRGVLADLNCYPSDKIDLESGLRTLLTRFGASTGLQIEFTCPKLPDDLTSDAALLLFRIAQEGLANVAKHAPQARSVSVELGCTTRYFRLVVEDDGGPPSGDGALHRRATRPVSGRGLRGMRERLLTVCGTLQAKHLQGRGFRVTARIPLAFVRT